MAEKDLRPTRYLLTLRYAGEFVTEFFEQNPISQLGIIGMRDGIAVRVSDMSGNPAAHLESLKRLRTAEPQGNPSLQNALEMARAALFHAPSHGTREALVVYGALLSSDPGDIHDTVSSLVTDRVRVSVVGLAAQVAICAELCSKTNAGDDSHYRVALNEVHFRELLMALTTPPVTRSARQSRPSLLMMGFPSRTTATKSSANGEKDKMQTPSKNGSGAATAVLVSAPRFCACHSKLTRGGYACARCDALVCSLPAECPCCGLTLILSTHLARSYHHLFPLRNWVEVSWVDAGRSSACFACLVPFPSRKGVKGKEKDAEQGLAVLEGPPVRGMSESGRYACEVCGNHFCIDCDVFAHEIVHNCPGCQSDTRDLVTKGAEGIEVDRMVE